MNQAESLYMDVLRSAVTWPFQMLRAEVSGSLRFESRVPEMAACCHSIEEKLMHQDEMQVYAGFQRLSHLTPAIAARYEQVAAKGNRVYIFAEFDDPDIAPRYPHLHFVALPSDHALVGEWFIAARGARFAKLFSAREKRRWPDERTFVGIITDLPPVVEQAFTLLESQLALADHSGRLR